MRHDLARAAVVVALALAACAPSSPPAPSTNPSSLPSTGAEASAMANQQRNRETVRRVYDDVLNTGKLELLSDMVADEYIAPDGRRGPSAFGDIMAKLRT